MKGNNKLILIVAILSVVLLYSCKKDFDKISTSNWNPQLASPLIKTKLQLSDLITTDSTFNYTDDSLLVFFYKSDSLIYLSIDTLLNYTDTTISSEFSLQDIHIDDFTLESEFTLQDILPNIDPEIADTLEQHDGQKIIMPPFELISEYGVELPPVDEYTEVSFSDGYIDIILKNNLPFTLDNITYEVWDAENDLLLEQFSATNLESGSVAFDTIYLAGLTISNTFSIKLNYFNSPGSFPDSIILDLSQGISFTLKTNNLKVVGGNAIINEQLNYTDETFVKMDFDEAKMKEVDFDKGSLNFTFHNNFGLSVSILLKLSSADIDGEIPYKEFVISPDDDFSDSWDLSGMNIDLTTDSTQPYNSFPILLEINLLPSNELVSFDTSQKIQIDFSTHDVILEYAEGNMAEHVEEIEQDTADLNISISNSLIGDIYFDQTELSISYNNGFGIPLLINTDFFGIKTNTGEELDLGLDSIIINYPQTPGEIIEDKIVFNKENSNIVDFLNFRPDKIVYSGNVISNWNDDTTNFITKNSYLYASSELKIPIVFRTTSLVFADTADVNVGDIGMTIGKGKLYLDITNGFPFNLSLNLKVPDSVTNEILDSLYIGVIPSAQVNTEGKVTKPTHKLVVADFDENFVSNLEKASKMLVWAQLITAEEGSIPVGLYSNYEISINISIQIQISP